ncbi:MAG: lytic transglycosylase domain-containing protein, partial [Pikeienuella sp.]
EAATRRVDISPALLAAVIATESAGKIRARSHAGAQGLAQLMPGTAARFGVKNAYDPAENLRGAAEYLAFLLEMFEGDTVLALAGYNAGEHAVTRHKGVPPYNETRDYIPKVLNYFAAAHKVECLFDTELTNAPCVPLQFPD